MWAGVLLVVLADAVTLGCVLWTRTGSQKGIYSVDTVPPAPVALVLGAGVNDDGTPSEYLLARLRIAKRLYDTGKVRALLVSGDNSRDNYDEPGDMRGWLVAHGVPENKVVADYAGFDTYDSCLRANKIFAVRKAIVVTQTYHVPRAVTLCRHLGVEATGVGDDSVRGAAFDWWQATFREQFACVKAAYDVATRRDPVFLGPHETGVDDALRD
jgi:vancomycin permeability regulator SanA